eukprot:403350792
MQTTFTQINSDLKTHASSMSENQIQNSQCSQMFTKISREMDQPQMIQNDLKILVPKDQQCTQTPSSPLLDDVQSQNYDKNGFSSNECTRSYPQIIVDNYCSIKYDSAVQSVIEKYNYRQDILDSLGMPLQSFDKAQTSQILTIDSETKLDSSAEYIDMNSFLTKQTASRNSFCGLGIITQQNSISDSSRQWIQEEAQLENEIQNIFENMFSSKQTKRKDSTCSLKFEEFVTSQNQSDLVEYTQEQQNLLYSTESLSLTSNQILKENILIENHEETSDLPNNLVSLPNTQKSFLITEDSYNSIEEQQLGFLPESTKDLTQSKFQQDQRGKTKALNIIQAQENQNQNHCNSMIHSTQLGETTSQGYQQIDGVVSIQGLPQFKASSSLETNYQSQQNSEEIALVDSNIKKSCYLSQSMDQNQSLSGNKQLVLQDSTYLIPNPPKYQQIPISLEPTNLNTKSFPKNSKIHSQTSFSLDCQGISPHLNKQRKRRQESRIQKPKEVLKYLQSEFEKNHHWSKEEISKISQRTNLTQSQVYKWNWDQKIIKNENHIRDMIKNKKYFGKIFQVQTHASQEKNYQIFRVEKFIRTQGEQ